MLSLATTTPTPPPRPPQGVFCLRLHMTVSTLSTCAAGIWDLVSIVESDDAGDTRRPRNILIKVNQLEKLEGAKTV